MASSGMWDCILLIIINSSLTLDCEKQISGRKYNVLMAPGK